ncbi:C40 family peptidase [Pseudoxanthomonas wuyuanensis]
MTTDDLPPGQPAAAFRPSRGTFRFLSLLALYAASTVAFAQSATADIEAGAGPVVADVPQVALVADSGPATTASIKSKAAEAATATLTALLPRLAASDAMPLMDRSAMFASDISRLLASYDLNKVQTDGVVAQEEGGKVQALLKRALTLLGTPYRWGGTSPESGFDCSGLVGYVFSNALGIELPRISRDMAAKPDAELIKNRDELKQGDLVFFGLRGRVNHVGIYVGEGRFLHSPSRGKDVRVDSLTSGYWSNRFMQARRVAL